MVFKGKTVAFLVAASVLLSSLGTAFVVGDGGLLDRLETGAFRSGGNGDFSDKMEKLEQAYMMIKQNYLHEVDDRKLIDGAISGMVESLGDPYSAYMNPQQANQFKADLQSKFTGIGAEVTMKNGRVTVVSPIKGSPAEKAGIRPEDQVLKVNGESLEGLDLTEAVSKIRGPKGSKAVLEISRPGERELLHITVIRDEISLQTVEAKMLDGKIGWIAISQFSESTADDFAKELKSLESQGMKGLVIDVRGNPGGLLNVVLDMGQQLLPKGKTIMMVEEGSGKRTVYKAGSVRGSKNPGIDEAKPYPIAVLTDKGSASASEILAAALRESGNYPVVGETSFGKGTVQTTMDFNDGSNLKLTMAKWLTPNGNWVDQQKGTKGIKPDVAVKPREFATAVPPHPSKPLKRDDNSTDVKNMQIILDALGFAPGRTDGYFDAKTEGAVKAFQKTHNLSQSGQLDAASAEKLREEFIALLRDPASDVQLQVAVQLVMKKSGP
ncbi:S41 family peptidase [Staphylospora marina]|uniref:S41 family peptidase n=1 Tax=Staphylospora marina TaxID=2490858 RepID=UPI000F5BD3F3|nr:S41 family peptidase [Staphylospora marina]